MALMHCHRGSRVVILGYAQLKRRVKQITSSSAPSYPPGESFDEGVVCEIPWDTHPITEYTTHPLRYPFELAD